MQRLEVYSGCQWPIDFTATELHELNRAAVLDMLKPKEHMSALIRDLVELEIVSSEELVMCGPTENSIAVQTGLSLEAGLSDEEIVKRAILNIDEYIEARADEPTVLLNSRHPTSRQRDAISKLSADPEPEVWPFLAQVGFVVYEGSKLLVKQAALEFEMGDADLHNQLIEEIAGSFVRGARDESLFRIP